LARRTVNDTRRTGFTSTLVDGITEKKVNELALSSAVSNGKVDWAAIISSSRRGSLEDHTSIPQLRSKRMMEAAIVAKETFRRQCTHRILAFCKACTKSNLVKPDIILNRCWKYLGTHNSRGLILVQPRLSSSIYTNSDVFSQARRRQSALMISCARSSIAIMCHIAVPTRFAVALNIDTWFGKVVMQFYDYLQYTTAPLRWW
jgi:hypothetical protein